VATEAVERLGWARPASTGEPAAAILRHERVPFVSYPYEWPVGMLRGRPRSCSSTSSAARSRTAYPQGQLAATTSSGAGARPSSSTSARSSGCGRASRGFGYRQFCMLFLYPLMLTAYRGVPFQPWLRGSLRGDRPGRRRAPARAPRPACGAA
jgi:hypothetical protein